MSWIDPLLSERVMVPVGADFGFVPTWIEPVT
jgi:hypothetical protein